MSRYQLREKGVFDESLGRVIHPGDIEWGDYIEHRRAGGDVDPIPPMQEPIEARRARASARALDAEERALRRPFSIGAGDFALGPMEQMLVLGAVAIDAAGGTVPSPFELWDTAGVKVALGPNQRRNLAEKIVTRRLRLYNRRRTKEAEVLAAADPDAVNPDDGLEGA